MSIPTPVTAANQIAPCWICDQLMDQTTSSICDACELRLQHEATHLAALQSDGYTRIIDGYGQHAATVPSAFWPTYEEWDRWMAACEPPTDHRVEVAHARHQFNKKRTASVYREYYYQGYRDGRCLKSVGTNHPTPQLMFECAGKAQDTDNSYYAYVAGFNTVTFDISCDGGYLA